MILELLASGALTLTTVTLLAPHLTPANHRDVLKAASNRSKREVEVLVAELQPQPPVPAMIRRLPQPRPMMAAAGVPEPRPGAAAAGAPEACQTRLEAGQASIAPGEAPIEPMRVTPTPPTQRPVVQPLAPQRYKIQFTAGAATVAKLRQVQDLLRHQVRDGDLGEVIDRALTALPRELVRRKAGAEKRPPAPRHPRIREAEVWARDRGRCAFVAPDGRRCGQTAFLEFHHLRPYARGGPATVENIELRRKPGPEEAKRERAAPVELGPEQVAPDTELSPARAPYR